MSYPQKPTCFWSPIECRGGDRVIEPNARIQDVPTNVRIVSLAQEIQEQLSERGLSSAASVSGDVLELRLAKSKFELMGGPQTGFLIVQLDVQNARRVSQELRSVPTGETSRSLAVDAIRQVLFDASTTSHLFHIGMRVEVVAGCHTGRRGNIMEKSWAPHDDWVVYLDSPPGCKRTRWNFPEGDLVPVDEDGTAGDMATQVGRAYLVACRGWTDGAARKPIRPGMIEDTHFGAIYLDSYTRGQLAAREEAERIAAKFGYKPIVVKACGG